MLSKQKLVGYFLKLLWWVEFCYSGAIEVSKLGREGFIWAIWPLFRVENEVVLKDKTGNLRSSQVKADKDSKVTGQLEHTHAAYGYPS